MKVMEPMIVEKRSNRMVYRIVKSENRAWAGVRPAETIAFDAQTADVRRKTPPKFRLGKLRSRPVKRRVMAVGKPVPDTCGPVGNPERC